MFALENCVDPSRRSICKYSHVRHRAGGNWSKQICLTERLFCKEIFLEAGEMGSMPPTPVVTSERWWPMRSFTDITKPFICCARLRFYSTVSMWFRVLIKFDPASLDLVCGTRVITWMFFFGKSYSLGFFELLLKLWKSYQGYFIGFIFLLDFLQDRLILALQDWNKIP